MLYTVIVQQKGVDKRLKFAVWEEESLLQLIFWIDRQIHVLWFKVCSEGYTHTCPFTSFGWGLFDKWLDQQTYRASDDSFQPVSDSPKSK